MKRIISAAALFLACLTLPHAAAQEAPGGDDFDLVEDFFGAKPAAPAPEGDAPAAAVDPAADAAELEGIESAVLAEEAALVEALGLDGDEDADPFTDFFQPPASDDEQPERGAAERGGERIEPVRGFEAGRQLALLEERPLLIVFGATWCGWCRKLEEELAAEEAEALLRGWIVVEVDIDEEPEVAERFEARGLPALRIVDTDAKTVASQTGYMPLDRLQSWLDEHLEQADPALQRVLLESSEPTRQQIAELAALLCRRSPEVRAAASRRLSAQRSLAATAMVDLLRTGPLTGQLAALDVLETWDAPTNGLDPWMPETLDEPALEPLLEWVRAVPDREETGELASGDRLPDVEAARRLVREMIAAGPLRRGELAAQAIAVGQPVALEVQRLLAAEEERFSDDQREWLRAVYYGVLAGNTMRLENAGLLRALAKLDAPTHRAAAEKLLRAATSQDQPLLDALAEDDDPLVRELAVMAFGRLGALGTGDRLQRLLADESPSVRTAVLRVLAEKPKAEITERLVDYLRTESQEDLLIYATKTLGQLRDDPQAADALGDLMDDARWRVRAAALDAAEQFLDKRSGSFGFFSSGDQPPVNEAVAEGILARLQDDDSFVKEKAVGLLPQILHKTTAERIAEFFLEDLDQLERSLGAVDEYERERKFQPLIELSQEWLEGTEEARVVDAALLLSKVSPTELRFRLDDLLQSEERRVRIAALQAVLPAVEQFREEAIQEEVGRWRLRTARSEKRQLQAIPLVRPLPDTFAPYQPPREDPPPTGSADEAEGDAPASDPRATEEPSSIDIAADFFGSTSPPMEEQNAAEAPVEEELAIAEAEPLASESEPAEGRSVFDLAASLFGMKSSRSVESRLEEEPEVSDELDVPSSEATAVALGSQWMRQWREREGQIPTWIRKIEPVVEQLTRSEHPLEQAWAQTAHLVLGHTEQIKPLLKTIQAEAIEGGPSAEAIVSWLPPEEALALVRQQIAAGIEAGDGWDDAGPWKIVSAATTWDNQALADYLWAERMAGRMTGRNAPNGLARHLVRAFVGENGYTQLRAFSDSELELDASKSLSDIKSGSMVPGQLEAARWVLDQYGQAETDEEKAILLASLSMVSRRHGMAEALAVLDQATEETLHLQVATKLALTDLTPLAADRAVVLLDHPVAPVAAKALRRLGSFDDRSSSTQEIPETPRLWSANRSLLGLQSMTRPLSAETLQRLKEEADGEASVRAAALLLFLGEPEDVGELGQQLRGMRDGLVLLTVSLAQARRQDDEAMAIYRQGVESADYSQEAALRRALARLSGREIQSLLQQL